MRAIMLTFLGLLMWLVIPLAAQNTAPVPVTFAIISGTSELEAHNVSGDLLPNDGVMVNTDRPDTLAPCWATVELAALNSDSSQATLNISHKKGKRNPIIHETITVQPWQQFWVPAGSGGETGTIADSLFAVVLDTSSMVIGDKFRIEISQAKPGGIAAQLLTFEIDTVKGTASDTSRAIYTALGVEDALFGFYAADATPEVDYMLQYNTGWGWGDPTPTDSLADKTWTDDGPASTWRFKDYGELPPATWARVIRIGRTAADTFFVRETLTTSPR